MPDREENNRFTYQNLEVEGTAELYNTATNAMYQDALHEAIREFQIQEGDLTEAVTIPHFAANTGSTHITRSCLICGANSEFNYLCQDCRETFIFMKKMRKIILEKHNVKNKNDSSKK